MNKKFVAYYRVSSRRQKKEGVSIEAQRKIVREYAKRNNFRIIKEFAVDESAKKSDRLMFTEMVKLVRKSDGINGIIGEKVDRLLRGNLKDRVLIEDLIDEYNKEVHLIREGLVLSRDSKSNDKFIFDLQSDVAKMFLNNLSDEVKKGYDLLVSQGYYPHIPPLGYKSKLENHLAIIDPDRSKYIKRAFELYATGEYSQKQISATLYDEGFRSRTGKKVGKSQIGGILNNVFYYGDFLWSGKVYSGNHKPIVSKDLFDKVKDLLHPKKKRGYKHNHSYIGLMKCGECGSSITAEIQKGHTYYRCTKPRGAKKCPQKYTREEVIESQLTEIVKTIALSLEQVTILKDVLRTTTRDETEYLEDVLTELNTRYSKLKLQSSKLLDLYLEGSVDKKSYDSRNQIIESEMDLVDKEITKHKKADRTYVKEIESLIDFCNQAPTLFKSSRPELQRELLRFVVSNLILKDKKLDFTLKTPFNILVKYSKNGNWQPYMESIRTFYAQN